MEFFLTGGHQRRHRTPVKRLLQRQDLTTLCPITVRRIFPRGLDHRLVGFCPGIGEEHTRQPARFHQMSGHLHHRLTVIQVGTVHQLLRLFADGLCQLRMPISQRVDADARPHVDIAPSFTVDERCALTADQCDVAAPVGLHDILLFHCLDLIKLHLRLLL